MKGKIVTLLISLLLIVTLIPSVSPAIAADQTEISYDDGTLYMVHSAYSSYMWGVKFTSPYTPAKLTAAKIYCSGDFGNPVPEGSRFEVHVLDASQTDLFSKEYGVTTGWNTIDLSAESLPPMESDFYIGVRCIDAYTPGIGSTLTGDYRSYSWINGWGFAYEPSENFMIRAIVEPVATGPTAELIADGGDNPTDVGDLNVSYANGVFSVDYSINGSWEIVETHVYVGDTVPAKSAPGKLPFSAGDIEYTPEGDKVYIAAYADIRMQTGVDEFGNPVYTYEGVWAQTGDGDMLIGKAASWATCFEYTLP